MSVETLFSVLPVLLGRGHHTRWFGQVHKRSASAFDATAAQCRSLVQKAFVLA